MDEFMKGFFSAIFFTERSMVLRKDWFDPDNQLALEEGQIDGVIPADVNEDDFDLNSLQFLESFARASYRKLESLLEEVFERGYEKDQAGIDLWFTTNGHGVGYWDRDILRENRLGDKMTELVRNHPIDLYYSEDGKIYTS